LRGKVKVLTLGETFRFAAMRRHNLTCFNNLHFRLPTVRFFFTFFYFIRRLMAFNSRKDKSADIFLRAFKDYVYTIIHELHNDTSKPQATLAIHTIAQQLNGDHSRLVYVNDVIQLRIREDSTWTASSAVDVYEMLALAIDPAFSCPNVPVIGACLVRHELMKSCQNQFQLMMTSLEWSGAFIDFLGQLCTTGKITSTTPGIVLHVLDSMVASDNLTFGDNFDCLTAFLSMAGPYLDGQVEGREYLTARMEQLQKKALACKVSVWLAVYGLAQLRERGWSTEVLGVEEPGEQQVPEVAADWMSSIQWDEEIGMGSAEFVGQN
jgi:hypothetical protein